MIYSVRLLFFLNFLLLATTSICQTALPKISGNLLTYESKPVIGAMVILMDVDGKTVNSYAISKSDGGFELHPLKIFDSLFVLKIEHMQYESWSRMICSTELVSGHLNLKIQLAPRNLSLQEITVKAPPLPYRTYNDTTEFRAKAYITGETRKVEDLLKNIQGFQLTDDGRIFFQGREIDRMLLEGEDLTDRHYRLLSKNLNASLIDRVQVVDNYTADRLMREVNRSGKIAINLTLDSTFRNRLSGTVGGATSGGRQMMDVSTVLPAGLIKWLTFTNFNQTGTQSGSQLSDDRLGENSISDSRQSRNSLSVFEPMQISQPPLDVRYARDNEDASTIQVLSIRNRKGQSLRLFAGHGQSRLHRNAELENRIKSVINNDWRLYQNTRYAMKTRESLVSFLFKHDRKSNTTGQFSMNIKSTDHRQIYEDQTTGDFADSLSEDHEQQRLILTSSGQETIRTGFGSLFKISYVMDIGQSEQHQALSTVRFLSIQSPVSGLNNFSQWMQVKCMSGHLDLSLLDRSKLGRWTGGLRMSMDREQQILSYHSAAVMASGSAEFLQRRRVIQSQAIIMHGTWQSTNTGKLTWFTAGDFGIAPFDVRDSIELSMEGREVYRLSAGLDYKLSTLSGIRFSAYRNRWTPSSEWFHSGPILQADGQVRYPALELKPETMTGINFTISRVNLPNSFTALLYASLIFTDGAYRRISSRSPSNSLTTYMPFNGQQSQFVSGSVSKHFLALRFKSMTDVSIQHINGNTRLDDVSIRNLYGRFSLHQRLISAFAFPLNAELSYEISRHYNRLKSAMTGDMNTAQWQHVGYARLNGRFGEKGFVSMIYGRRLLSASETLNTIDLFTRWKASKSLYLSITGHNLTNAMAMERRTVSLNATTDQRTSLVGRYILFSAEWSF